MASRSAEHALPQTAKFRTAVALMNRAPAAKFRLILQRVIKNIHKKVADSNHRLAVLCVRMSSHRFSHFLEHKTVQ